MMNVEAHSQKVKAPKKRGWFLTLIREEVATLRNSTFPVPCSLFKSFSLLYLFLCNEP